jgi:hypothetical protein
MPEAPRQQNRATSLQNALACDASGKCLPKVLEVLITRARQGLTRLVAPVVLTVQVGGKTAESGINSEEPEGEGKFLGLSSGRTELVE